MSAITILPARVGQAFGGVPRHRIGFVVNRGRRETPYPVARQYAAKR